MNPPSSSSDGSAKKRRKYGSTPGIEVESPSWLPSGWITLEKTRQNGVTAGTKDKYYYDPITGHGFRSMREVNEYRETGQIPKPKSKLRKLQSGNNEFQSVTLHSVLEAVTRESADPKNNDINFNQETERVEEQNQRSNPHLKCVNTFEFRKADGFPCTKKSSNDDFGRKKKFLDIDLNKIPDETNIPFHSVTDAGERKSPPMLKNDLGSNLFLGYATPKTEASLLPTQDQTNDHWLALGYATPKPEACLLPTQGQTNDHCLAQPMQNMNIKFSTEPFHCVKPMTKSLLNTGSSSSPPAQQKVIPIHDPASPCSVLPMEKQSDKQKTTEFIKRENKKRLKTTGAFSKVTRQEIKISLAEFGRNMCKKYANRIRVLQRP